MISLKENKKAVMIDNLQITLILFDTLHVTLRCLDDCIFLRVEVLKKGHQPNRLLVKEQS
jgi:hypothetical protein